MPPKSNSSSSSSSGSSSYLFYIILILVLAGIGFGIYYYIKNRKIKNKPDPSYPFSSVKESSIVEKYGAYAQRQLQKNKGPHVRIETAEGDQGNVFFDKYGNVKVIEMDDGDNIESINASDFQRKLKQEKYTIVKYFDQREKETKENYSLYEKYNPGTTGMIPSRETRVGNTVMTCEVRMPRKEDLTRDQYMLFSLGDTWYGVWYGLKKEGGDYKFFGRAGAGQKLDNENMHFKFNAPLDGVVHHLVITVSLEKSEMRCYFDGEEKANVKYEGDIKGIASASPGGFGQTNHSVTRNEKPNPWPGQPFSLKSPLSFYPMD